MRLVFARHGYVARQGLVRSGVFRDTLTGPLSAFMHSILADRVTGPLFVSGVSFHHVLPQDCCFLGVWRT